MSKDAFKHVVRGRLEGGELITYLGFWSILLIIESDLVPSEQFGFPEVLSADF